MRLFQRLALDKNQLAINSATVTARSIFIEVEFQLSILLNLLKDYRVENYCYYGMQNLTSIAILTAVPIGSHSGHHVIQNFRISCNLQIV